MSGAVPIQRFPGFDGDWARITVGSIGPVLMCKRVMKDQTSSEGDVPFFKIGTFGKDADAFIEQDLFDKFRAKYSYPKPGDILISAAGTIGRLVVFDGKPAYFQDSNIVWVANDETCTLNPFLYYCYQNTQWTTEDTTIARLYNDNLRSIEIVQPNIAEQQKIADFLGTVDSKLEALRRKKSGLEAFKSGLMQRLFSQTLRFTRDDGTDFPDWEEMRLGDYLRPWKQRVGAATDIPVYSSSREGLLPQKEYFADREVSNEGEYGIVPDGYVTYRHMSDDLTFKFNMNNFGHSVAVSKEYPVFDASGMDLQFLVHWLNNTREFSAFAAAQKKGGTRTRLHFSVLQELLLWGPASDEQRKIADALSALDAKIAAVADQISHMEAFKKGLLQKMFV